jgi:hypothetical protein
VDAVEIEARRVVAKKMRLTDTSGSALPEDLWSQGVAQATKNLRKKNLLVIMHAALVNTRERPPTLRGPYVISDADLDDAIASSERLLKAYDE